ncbi:MAG: hypothetical protein HUJ72_06155, partial [Blautia sp.]|nr:hypothetical protein [Blautia sp.]
YSGNIYNASGSDASIHGALNGSALNVTFGANTTYSGAAASTAAIHVTYEGAVKIKENGGFAFDSEEAANAFAEEYQNVSFDITHYFDLGHVANLIHANGANNVNISLTDNAIWKVTGTSLVQSLSIEGDAQVVVPEGITLTVGENEYTNCTLTADML